MAIDDCDSDDLALPPPSPPSKRQRLLMVPVVRRMSTKELLSSFGAVKSPDSVTKMQREAGRRPTRDMLPPPTYAESPLNSPGGVSVMSDMEYQNTPEESEGTEPADDDSQQLASGADASEDELNGDNITVVPRGTLARRATEQQLRTLPERSRRSNVDYHQSVAPAKRIFKKTGSKSKRVLTSDTAGSSSKKPKVETARNRVRQDIADHTKPLRNAFLLSHKDYFTPLLPENSYIQKLERSTHDGQGEVKYRPLTRQPRGVLAIMKPYQLDGLSFLLHMHNNGMSAILGDEMGLGKTLQTLALFQYLAENAPTAGEHRPHLVVCPLSVLSSWISEARKWIPGQKVIRFHGPKTERERFMQTCNASKGNDTADLPDIVVTTYDTFKAEQGWFKRAFVWRYCVLDEGHMIKNDASNISTALQGLGAEYRLLLTGTPLQNNLREMWSLLHWLFPEVFTKDTEEDFRTAFDLNKGQVSTAFMDDARRLLELIMLRRMKASPGVNLGLPPKEEILLYVPLTPMQRFWYTRLLTRESAATLNELFASAKDKEARVLEQHESDDEQLALLEKAGSALQTAEEVDTTDVWAESRAIMQEALQTGEAEKGTNDWRKLMNILMQLRKVCNHPYLLPNAAPDVYDIGDHIKNASGKFIVLDKLIDELVLKQRKKILIFSGFTRTLNLVGELLSLKGVDTHNAPFQYARLDGGTNRAQRNLAIRMFNDMDSEYKVMLLSTRAGGLGINLTSATDVVFMDEDWNPQVTIQAEARAHRIGQTKKVTIYKLCSQGTVEEQMLGRIRKKLYLSAKITESMRNIHTEGSPANKKRKRQFKTAPAEDDAPHLDTASLQSLIRRGAQTLARPQIDVEKMISWDWETVLETCKDKPIDPLVSEAQGDTAADEETWLNTMERVETAIFEGKKHQKEIEKKMEQITDLDRNARRINKNTTVEIDGFMISKESLNCADWEAVPTFAGKDPRLAEPKREKKEPIQHQDICQMCWEDGELVMCSGCPRSYHRNCLPKEHGGKTIMGQFYCPQHQCHDCGSKTTEAGGLILRCRWCEKGYCEDCLDWEASKRVAYTLPEFEMLGFGYVAQAYFIECHDCVKDFENDDETREEMLAAKAQYETDYQVLLASLESNVGAERTPETISEAVTPLATDMGYNSMVLPYAHLTPGSSKKAKKL